MWLLFCTIVHPPNDKSTVDLVLGAIKHQAITWTSVGLIFLCHIAPPGTRELNINILCRLPFVLNWMDLCWRDKTPMLKTMQLCLFSHFFPFTLLLHLKVLRFQDELHHICTLCFTPTCLTWLWLCDWSEWIIRCYIKLIMDSLALN